MLDFKKPHNNFCSFSQLFTLIYHHKSERSSLISINDEINVIEIHSKLVKVKYAAKIEHFTKFFHFHIIKFDKLFGTGLTST